MAYHTFTKESHWRLRRMLKHYAAKEGKTLADFVEGRRRGCRIARSIYALIIYETTCEWCKSSGRVNRPGQCGEKKGDPCRHHKLHVCSGRFTKWLNQEHSCGETIKDFVEELREEGYEVPNDFVV